MIADQIRPGTPHQSLRQAISALAEVNFNTHPWLLILDNADELREDYARFFPSVPGGSILLTSRNHECAIHETVGYWDLDSISSADSVRLLFKAAKLPEQDWKLYRGPAERITKLLGCHTLTLIQAGAFISRDIRNWNEYPNLFKKNRQHLLTIPLNQAQSKYGNVYAAFEVSARALESDGSTEAEDALCLLGIFAMFHHSGFPTSVFQDASEGLKYAERDGYCNEIGYLSAGLANLLPAFLSQSGALTLRLQSGLHLLEALSFIKQANTKSQDDAKLVSMHPLAHAWAKDRLDKRSQEYTWLMTGSIIAFSAKAETPYPHYWNFDNRDLRTHIESLADNRLAYRPHDLCLVKHLQVDYVVVSMLRKSFSRESAKSLVFEIIETIEAKPFETQIFYLRPFRENIAFVLHEMKEYQKWIAWWRRETHILRTQLYGQRFFVSQYQLAAAHMGSGSTHDAVICLEDIVAELEDTYSAINPYLLNSQLDLGRAYLRDGQSKEAVTVFENVVRTQWNALADSLSSRLITAHGLGCAYLDSGQAEKAIEFLEHIVQIQQSTLAESSPDRVTSEYQLGCAYVEVTRYYEAMQLFQHVAGIRRKTLFSADPALLRALRFLPDLYIRFEQPERAKEVVLEFQDALGSLPTDDARWCKYGTWLVGWKQYFGIEAASQAVGEYDLYLEFDARPDSSKVGYGSGSESRTGLDTDDAAHESEAVEELPYWRRFARNILNRTKRKKDNKDEGV